MMDLERESPAAAHWSRQQYESLFEPALSSRSERRRVAWLKMSEKSRTKSQAKPRRFLHSS
jgi:hypothetical protein